MSAIGDALLGGGERNLGPGLRSSSVVGDGGRAPSILERRPHF